MVLIKYFRVLKHQERLNDNKKRMRDDFRGCKTPCQIKPIYLEVKLKEAKFD